MKDAQAAVCSNLPFFSPLLRPPDLLASFFSSVVVASAASFLPAHFPLCTMLAHISRITISAHASVGYAVWQEHNQDMTGSTTLSYSKTPALNQVPAPSKFPYVVCKLKGPPAIKKVGAIDPPILSFLCPAAFIPGEGGRRGAPGGSKFQFYSNFLSPPPTPTNRPGNGWEEVGGIFYPLPYIYPSRSAYTGWSGRQAFLIGTITENRVMAKARIFLKKERN